MKNTSNTIFIAAAAAIMAVAYRVPPQTAGTPDAPVAPVISSPAVPSTSAAVSDNQQSPCKAYSEAPKNATAAKSYGDALIVWKRFFGADSSTLLSGVTYVIALAPDPIHTHLSLQFDRTMETIQAAAQDESYVYDSSWLPWQLGVKTYPLRSDEKSEEGDVDSQNGCPGLLLFRSRVSDHHVARDLYTHGLAVFVVSDEPTRGINTDEWNEAIRFIGQQDPADKALRVLGPSFSGSLPSLSRLLAQDQSLWKEFNTAVIYSGAVSSCGSIVRFNESLAKLSSGGTNGGAPRIMFGSFSENSELQLYRLLNHLEFLDKTLADVAIVSEDETAYGQSDAGFGRPEAGCTHDYGIVDVPVWLFYPRDISAVRTAYLQQSVFSRSQPGGPEGGHPRTVLRPVIPSGPASQDSDTVTRYSQDEVQIEQEARLYELVSFLSAHHTHFIVLRGSNPDDLLFLTRFFHHTYPEGRIILLRSDELLRREIDTSEFRGVLLLTNYPLLPREQHWARLITKKPDGASYRHVHRVFPSDVIEGEYIASRFLFDKNTSVETHGNSLQTIGFKENIPDYADPIWMHTDSISTDHNVCKVSVPCYVAMQPYVIPPTWLVAVGRDGNWPVSVLRDDSETSKEAGAMTAVHPAALPAPQGPPLSTITKLTSGGAIYDWSLHGRPVPVPWRIALVCCLILASCHIFAAGVGILSPQYARALGGSRYVLSLFRPSSYWRIEVLIGTSTGIVFGAAFLLLFGPLWYHQQWNVNYGATTLYPAGAAFVVLFLTVLIIFALNNRHRSFALPAFALVSALWAYMVVTFTLRDTDADGFSLLYRSVHLTDGVSPFLPLLCILAGLYCSTILGLREMDLLVTSPVRLPMSEDGACRRGARAPESAYLTAVKGAEAPGMHRTAGAGVISTPIPRNFFRISRQFSSQAAAFLVPFSPRISVWLPPILVAGTAMWVFRDEAPTLTLEGPFYSKTLLCCLTLAALIAMSHALNLYLSWGGMRAMLRALGGEPLRRSFAALRSAPQASIWTLGTGAHAEQLRGLSNEIESLTHLRNLLVIQAAHLPQSPARSCLRTVEKALFWGKRVKEGCAIDAGIIEQSVHRPTFCKWLGNAVEAVFNAILIPSWSEEKQSLHLNRTAIPAPEDAGAPAVSDAAEGPPLSGSPIVQTAEEFVCHVYIAHTKRMLSCMRSVAKSGGFLFLAIGAAISSYPILSRNAVVFALLAMVAAVFVLVIQVYMEMARDEILSLMTGTKPGELDAEFWFKIIGFGIGPVVGLLAAFFPAATEAILSVLGPNAIGK